MVITRRKSKMLSTIKNYFKGRETSHSKVEDYIFVDKVISKDEVVTGIKIKSGPLSGMIFTANPSVNFTEKKDGHIDMHFEYVVQVAPENREALLNNELVTNTLGDIISDIIKKNLDTNDANRDIDFKRSSEGPGVCQEG